MARNIERVLICLLSYFLSSSRKDLTLKGCKVDVILITGMLSPYASMVEKLHRDVEKERVTILKIERAGDVLADAVSTFLDTSRNPLIIFGFIYSRQRSLNPYFYSVRVKACSLQLLCQA